MDKVKEMQDNLYNKQASLLAIGQEKNGKMELIKQQNQQAMILKEKINALEGRKNSIQERIDSIQEEIDEQNANLHTKTKQLNDIKSNI